MTRFVPEGVITSLVTPFQPDGLINRRVMAELIETQIAAGVSAIVVTGGAGEYVSLRPEERADMVRWAAEAIRGRVALVAGVLAPDTGSAVSAALGAREAGAQAILLLTPFYVSPSGPGVVTHYRQVAEAVGLPIILYNNPTRTGLNLDVPVLEQLVELPGVVAIKECDRDLGRVAVKMKRVGARIAFLSGDDDLSLPCFSLGMAGAIMASTNLVAPWTVALFDATRQGDWSAARDLFYTRLLPLLLLYRGPDHPGPLKQVVGLTGIEVGPGRPPLHPLGEGRLAEIAQSLRELGLIKQAQPTH